MAFDLNEIKIIKKEGTEMPIRHPATDEIIVDEQGNAAVLILAGSDSDVYKKAQNMVANRCSRKMKMPKAEAIQADAIEILAKCTLGWKNLVINGVEPASAEIMYTEYPWLKEQADTWIHDRANYLGN